MSGDRHDVSNEEGDSFPSRRETIVESAQVDRQDQDDAAETELVERHELSRRTLFGATGGFALAATGLLLPDWLVEEAAADTHPVSHVQRRAAKRRKKHHRHVHRHDRRRRHDDSDKPRGLGPKGIRLTVVNETDVSFSNCEHCVGTIGWGRDTLVYLHKRGSNQNTFTADTDELHTGILFSGEKQAFVWVENPVAGTPNTTYQYGGSMKFPIGYLGGTIDVDHGPLEEGAETTHRISFTNSATFAVKVRRETDVPGFKFFKMTILPD